MCQDFISSKRTINKILEFKMIMYNTKLTATKNPRALPLQEKEVLGLFITFLNSLQFLISTILFADLQVGYSWRDWALNIKQHPKLVKKQKTKNLSQYSTHSTPPK